MPYHPCAPRPVRAARAAGRRLRQGGQPARQGTGRRETPALPGGPGRPPARLPDLDPGQAARPLRRRRQGGPALPRREGPGHRHLLRLRHRDRQDDVRLARPRAEDHPVPHHRLRQPRDRPAERPDRLLRGHLHHQPQPQETRGLRRPLLPGRPVAPGPQGREHHPRPGRPRRQARLLGRRLHAVPARQGRLPESGPGRLRHLLRLRGQPPHLPGRRGHHRRRHPHRLRGQGPERTRARRQAVLQGALRHRRPARRQRPAPRPRRRPGGPREERRLEEGVRGHARPVRRARTPPARHRPLPGGTGRTA